MLYVVWYSKRESRITGSYLINTTNKKEARKIFRDQISEGIRKIELVEPFSDLLENVGETQEEFMCDTPIPELGGYVLIEAGT